MEGARFPGGRPPLFGRPSVCFPVQRKTVLCHHVANADRFHHPRRSAPADPTLEMFEYICPPRRHSHRRCRQPTVHLARIGRRFGWKKTGGTVPAFARRITITSKAQTWICSEGHRG